LNDGAPWLSISKSHSVERRTEGGGAASTIRRTASCVIAGFGHLGGSRAMGLTLWSNTACIDGAMSRGDRVQDAVSSVMNYALEMFLCESDLGSEKYRRWVTRGYWALTAVVVAALIMV
jgi:hypothetical protein